MRPLATQLRATPPAITRFLLPVCFVMWATSLSIVSSTTNCTEAARSLSRSGDRRLALARRAAKQLVEALVGHQRAVEVAEIAGVEAKRTVVAHVDQPLADEVGIAGLTVRRQAHQLVLARVDLESAVVGKGAIEQPEGVRVADLLEQFDVAAATMAESTGGPFADAVDGQDRGLVERRGIEATGGVRQVVLRDEQTRPQAENLFQVVREPCLDAQERAAGFDELILAPGRLAHHALDHAVEGQQRVVVKDDGRQLRGVDERLAEAVVNGPAGEARIVFLAGKTLFLRGRYDIAAAHQRGRRIVVIGR